jgi:hypothetical protein
MMEADRLERQLRDMELRMDYKLRRIMATQADIDQLVSRVSTVATDIQGKVSLIGTDVSAIKAALAAIPPTVDITALTAAVSDLEQHQGDLDTSVDSVTALAPAAQQLPAAPAS